MSILYRISNRIGDFDQIPLDLSAMTMQLCELKFKIAEKEYPSILSKKGLDFDLQIVNIETGQGTTQFCAACV